MQKDYVRGKRIDHLVVLVFKPTFTNAYIHHTLIFRDYNFFDQRIHVVTTATFGFHANFKEFIIYNYPFIKMDYF